MNIKDFIKKDKPALLNALIITILFYTLEEILFKYPQISYYKNIIHTSELSSAKFFAISSSILMLICTFIFFYGLFKSPFWLRVIYLFFFIGISIGQYGFQKSLQRFTVAYDVEIGVTTTNEVWIDGLRLYFDWKVVIPIIILFIFLWITKTRKSTKTGIYSLGLVFILPAIHLLFKPLPSYGLNGGISIMQGFNSGVNYLQLISNRPERDKITYQSNTSPKNNIVLIIDESLRGTHLSINGYSRPTTPYLEELSVQTELFHNWGIAVSGATCSNPANSLLITGAPIEENNFEITYKYPTIFQYAKSMGYRTIYIDVQTNILWNGLNSSDLQYLDNRITNNDLIEGKNPPDFNAAERINNIIGNSVGNFIVINKTGVHFIYEDVYPEHARVWSPVPQNAIDYKNPELTINSYDNAILFNINGFFEELFPESDQLNVYTENTFFIYTSDHAESLYANEISSLHCAGTKPETEVPLIIFGKLPNEVDTHYKASHSNIFATILDLMNVPAQARIHEYNLSLLQAKANDSKDRLFFKSYGEISIYEKLP